MGKTVIEKIIEHNTGKEVKPGDIVVTQDYGLASMCLARCAKVLNQNGLEYTADNMEALMLRRYENKKLLRAGMK